jgi:ubiquinone biosynthesis protein
MNKFARAVYIAKHGLAMWTEIKKAQKFDYDFSEAGPKINQHIYKLGPTFIKLGQMLSLRTDIIPVGLADQLRKLLDRGDSVEEPLIVQLLNEEFGKTADQLFQNFEPAPFAVASISQVHRATYNRQKIAVKIQKPGTAETIHEDLRVLTMLLPLMNLVPSLRPMRALARNTINEFFHWIDHELDYRLEALNMSRIGANFADIPYFKVPTVIHELSTKRVLCMEFIDGVSLNEIFDNVPNFSALETISYRGVSFNRKEYIDHAQHIVFKQVIEDGYFHADPHPGNIIVTKDGKIAYIDFGIVGVIPSSLRKALADVFSGLINQDVEKIAKTLVSIDQIEGHEPMEQLENEIRLFVNDWQSGSIMEKSTAQAFFDLLQIALHGGIDLPLPAIILGKTVLEYDGVLRKLDPEFDLLRSFEPMIAASAGMKNWVTNLVPTSIKDMAAHLESFPDTLHDLIKTLAKEGMEVSLRFGGTQPQDSKIPQPAV